MVLEVSVAIEHRCLTIWRVGGPYSVNFQEFISAAAILHLSNIDSASLVKMAGIFGVRHNPVLLPTWFPAIRATQLFFALLIIGLTAYSLSMHSASPVCASRFCPVFERDNRLLTCFLDSSRSSPYDNHCSPHRRAGIPAYNPSLKSCGTSGWDIGIGLLCNIAVAVFSGSAGQLPPHL